MTDAAASPPRSVPLCAGTNRDGRPCEQIALPGRTFCQFHDDAPQDDVQDAQKSPMFGRPRLQHGLYAKSMELPPDLQDKLATFEAGVVTDLGGASELTTIERGYIEKLRTVETAIYLVLRYIERKGFDAKTEGMLLSAIDRWDRLALRLGMARRQRKVDPLEAVRLAVIEANKEQPSDKEAS